MALIMIISISLSENQYHPTTHLQQVDRSCLGIGNQISVLHSSERTDPNVTKQSLADRIKKLIARICHQLASTFEAIRSFTFRHINTAYQWFHDTTFQRAQNNSDPFDLSGNNDEPWRAGIRQIFYGNQRFQNGPVDSGRVYSILHKLSSAAPNGIHFNQASFNPYLDGGTCTAMSLEFLSLYLKRGNQEDLLDQVTKTLSFSSKELRNRQRAYNMIEVDRDLLSQPCQEGTSFDYSKNKIQAIANYHDLKIDYASEELDLKISGSNHLFDQLMEKLPQGAFLIRVLKPANNSKMEEFGHSLAYIQDGKTGLLYDPNKGLRQLDPDKKNQVLYRLININVVEEFDASRLRFYRLQ